MQEGTRVSLGGEGLCAGVAAVPQAPDSAQAPAVRGWE